MYFSNKAKKKQAFVKQKYYIYWIINLETFIFCNIPDILTDKVITYSMLITIGNLLKKTAVCLE